MSFTTTENFLQRVQDRLHNKTDGTVQEAVVDRVAQDTVNEYSRLFPRRVSITIDGDATLFRFPINSTWTTAGWVTYFSRIEDVWYPYAVETRDIRQEVLDNSEWHLDPNQDSPTHLQFPTLTPATGTGNIRIAFTALHTLSISATTIPTHHQPAVEELGACAVSRVEAARHTRLVDSGIEGDSVDHASKAEEWRSNAEMFCDSAYEQLGISRGPGGEGAAQKAAGGWQEWDPMSRTSGGPGTLFHPRSKT